VRLAAAAVTAHGKRGQRSRKRRRGSGTPPAQTAAPSPSTQTQTLAEPAPQTTAARVTAAVAARRARLAERSGRATNEAAARRARAKRGKRGGLEDMLPLGKRPQSPWHPLPLSELLILVGAIGTIVGLSRGISNGGAPLFAGIAAVAIGTVEVTLREHLSGYRSHAIILAALPVLVLDTLLVLLIAPFGIALKLGMIALDLFLFVSVYRLLRGRFAEARRERVFTGGR
jgi:hypothetical protein